MNRRNVVLITVVLCLLLIGSSVLAQGGTTIEWWVFGGGGAPSSGGGVSVNDTLGQPVIGASGGGDVVLGAGYWYAEIEDIEPPKPVPPEPVGGHTEPVSSFTLPGPLGVLVLAIGAGIVVAVVFRRRRK